MGNLIAKAVEGGVPVVFVVAGIVFIFVALVNLSNAQAINRSLLGLLGGIFLVVGIAFYAREEPVISESEPPSISSEVALSKWASSGEKIIFDHTINADGELGIEAFENAKYKEAVSFFENAVYSDPNNPELQIYFNNSKARLSSDRHVLAAVVPAEQGQDDAEAVLRGVADSQTNCNEENENKIEFIIMALLKSRG